MAHDVPSLYPPRGEKAKIMFTFLRGVTFAREKKDRSRSFPLLSFEAVSLPNPQVACS